MRRGWFGRPAPLDDPQEAMAAAAATLPGFAPLGAVAEGGAALVVGRGRRVALARRERRRVRAVEIGWRDVRATRDGLVVTLGRASVTLAGISALDVRRLSP